MKPNPKMVKEGKQIIACEIKRKTKRNPGIVTIQVTEDIIDQLMNMSFNKEKVEFIPLMIIIPKICFDEK